MKQMLSLSTGSEFLRPRHAIFFVVRLLVSLFFFFNDDLANVTPRVTGVTFSLYTCVMCCCVISASAYTSAGPLRLKQHGVVTLVISTGFSDSHTAHSTHSSALEAPEIDMYATKSIKSQKNYTNKLLAFYFERLGQTKCGSVASTDATVTGAFFGTRQSTLAGVMVGPRCWLV